MEIVRAASELLREAHNSGEVTGGLLDLCAPDIRVDASRRVFNPDVYHGHAGMQRMIREIWDAWEDFSETIERLIDAGDKIVSLQTISGRGRASKAEVQASGALIWTLRDRRILCVETFIDQQEALEAVGLGV